MQALTDVAKVASSCTRCRLAETRIQVVFGVGNPSTQLLVLGEAPGRNEDEKGEPFVGMSGKLLDTLIQEELGLDRSQFFITNVVKCRPPENRNPKPDEIASCRPWLEDQLRILDPKVILTVGNFAVQTVLGTKEGITKLRGRVHEFDGRRLIATFHPAMALRSRVKTVPLIREDLQLAKSIIDAPGSLL